ETTSVTVKRLMAGDFFGEFACIYHLPRSATIVAKSHVLLLEFSAQSIEKLIKHSPMAGDYLIRTVQNRMVHAMTHTLPAFRQIPEEDRLWIAEESTINEYDDGSTVIEESSENPACHILLSGRLELKLPNGASTELTSGTIFGKINPYIRIPPQATLRTREHALVCNMPEKIFNSFMNAYPSFGQYLKTQQHSLALT
ncbi:MAG: cyclic nucleotide-binding domain-containing protein, partial [Mariprofundus sp.]